VQPGRLLGLAMGIVILVAVFLLPIGAIPDLVPAGSTVYGAFAADASNLNSIQNSNDSDLVTSSFMLMIAAVLLTLAGVIGIFPLFSAVLSLLGISLLTVGPFVTGDSYIGVEFDWGFYVVWVASFVTLFGAFWKGKPRPVEKPVYKEEKEPPTEPPPGLAPAPEEQKEGAAEEGQAGSSESSGPENP
jgi:hypothetical protein